VVHTRCHAAAQDDTGHVHQRVVARKHVGARAADIHLQAELGVRERCGLVDTGNVPSVIGAQGGMSTRLRQPSS
jgi:hypothetical protein